MMFHIMYALQSIPHTPTDNVQADFSCPATIHSTAVNRPTRAAWGSGAFMSRGVCPLPRHRPR